MPLDFPDAPSPGQAYGQWIWNGIAWVSSLSGAGTYPVGGVLFGLSTGAAGTDPDNLLFDVSTGSLAIGGALSLGTPLAIASGGTGAITGAGAVAAIGAVSKAGDTMTGVLTLFGAPSADFDAATKSYVDNAPNSTITLIGAISGSGASTISTTLATVPVLSGGTGATAAAAALDNLSGASGTVTGSLTRSSSGFWTVTTPPGGGTITAVNPGAGLSGGGTAGSVTLSLIRPVTVANGGTGATTQAAALTSLGALPLAGGTMTGNLTVNGAIQGNGAVISEGANAQLHVGQADGARFWLLYAPAATSEIRLFNSSTGDALTVDTSANLTINGPTATKPGGGPWVAPSDRSLKSSVEPWQTGLEAVLALEPKTYRYNDEQWNLQGTDYIGLDAEDAAAIIPEMARSITLPAASPEAEPITDVAAIDSGPLIYALVNAVKELNTKFDELAAALPPGVAPLPGPQ